MVQSIDRAMHIISVLTDSKRSHWSISEIAENASLPLSTTHRLLGTMMKYDLVTQNPKTKHYQLGFKWMELGLTLLEKSNLRIIARPIMEQLAEEAKETIYLNIPKDLDSIIIERVDSPLKVRIIDNLGERIPLYIGAANKTMLANMDSHEVQQRISKFDITEQKKKALSGQLPDIQKAGYAISYGEKTEGTASIAAPIMGYHQQVLGALSIGVLSYQITEERIDDLVKKVKEAAQSISRLMGDII